jgi:pseudaminic acid cytidylyltransferase
MTEKAIAIIPARGGSKRIPRKNIKLFAGKPMIAYPIEAALASGCFERVIVSTDDLEIAEIARAYGAEVPFVRPAELADDFSNVGQVLEHALDWLECHQHKLNYYCVIYATNPFLMPDYLKQGLALLENTPDAISALAITSMPFPVQRTFSVTPEHRLKMFWPEYFFTRSQDLPEAYQDAGQFFWVSRVKEKVLPKDSVGFGHHVVPVILPRYLVQDLDTPEDWLVAEYMYQALCLSGQLSSGENAK